MGKPQRQHKDGVLKGYTEKDLIDAMSPHAKRELVSFTKAELQLLWQSLTIDRKFTQPLLKEMVQGVVLDDREMMCYTLTSRIKGAISSLDADEAQSRAAEKKDEKEKV